jgi:chemotaxis protein methyltransferase CheR
MIKVTTDDIKAISKYILDISGINLDESKAYLVETRLGGLTKEYGCSSYRELCGIAKADPKNTIENEIINAISTNETLFFRDTDHLKYFNTRYCPI